MGVHRGRLAHSPQEVHDQDNDQYGPESHTGASAGAPAAMPVVPPASAKQQHQNDKQDQHLRSISFRVFRAPTAAIYLSNTFSTCPTFFWTLPASFSAWPS